MSLLLKYIELNWIEINFTGKTTNFKPFYGSGPSVDGIRAETGKLFEILKQTEGMVWLYLPPVWLISI